MLVESFTVESPNVKYTEDFITSKYEYASTKLNRSEQGEWKIKPTTTTYEFRVERKVPKLG